VKFDEQKIATLLLNEGIIRNRLKVNAIVHNAALFQNVQKEWGSFRNYIWHFVDGKPLVNQWPSGKVPATTEISDRMCKDLKKRGFKFVGSTICYAFMQAVGMVNDHTKDCFRHKEIIKGYNKKKIFIEE